MIQVNFHNTHSYPGCRATVLFGARMRREGKTLVEFSDGSVALGRYRRAGEGVLVLHVASYRTAKKTPIEAKVWRLERVGRPGNWKVAAKAN